MTRDDLKWMEHPLYQEEVLRTMPWSFKAMVLGVLCILAVVFGALLATAI